MPEHTGAAVIVGNEVLSGKVDDQNGPLLIHRLREHGIPLVSLTVVPDEVDAIVEAIVYSRKRAMHVFTSGGIGPTHDDVTVRAVALALGRRVLRLAEIEERIRRHYGSETTGEALRLADVPEGATLWYPEGSWYPVLSCDRVYLLPGVPRLFRLQLETVLDHIERGEICLRTLYLTAREAQIAAALDRVALAMPDVAIGSYPTFDCALGYEVKVTIEHRDWARVDAASTSLKGAFPPGIVLREE